MNKARINKYKDRKSSKFITNKQKIKIDIINYYLSLTNKEIEEDKEWDKIAVESAKKLWND